MDLKEIALDWIDAWNKKDIDRIMDHYSDDVLFFAPTVIKREFVKKLLLLPKYTPNVNE